MKQKHVMSTHLKNFGEAHLMSTHNISFMERKKKYNHQILILNNSSVCFIFKTGFDISWNLSPIKTICMKCQILCSGKSKTITTSSHAQLPQKVINVKGSNITPTPKKEMVWHFMQMSNPIFWRKFNKYHQFIAAELVQRVEKVKG